MEIKRLSNEALKDIELKNHARRLAGLSRIKIMVRRCRKCDCLFESAGNFFCNDCHQLRGGHVN